MVASLAPADLVRQAREEWLVGNRDVALGLLSEAEVELSPLRVYQLLGVEVTLAIYRKTIRIVRRKSVIIVG